MSTLQYIPKIDDFLAEPSVQAWIATHGQTAIVSQLRTLTDSLRQQVQSGETTLVDKSDTLTQVVTQLTHQLNQKNAKRLQPVINATGIVIHTNLGRAPLSQAAVDNIATVAGSYSNLEYNLATGKRGSRLAHIETILCELTGAEAAVVVNNNAAAVFLALNSLCHNQEVIVSRGELVEIGGSFRVSEIIERSGCQLKEVGTTNKTKPSDYTQAVTAQTAAFLKVHRSNFTLSGFTQEVSAAELMSLTHDYPHVITIEDMGSGILVDLSEVSNEPTVQQAVANGVDVITFSGDKVLGGPQAGIIVGKKVQIDAMKNNQLYRMLRLDKLCLAALETTLEQYLAGKHMEIPVINALLASTRDMLYKAHELRKYLYPNPHISSYVDIAQSLSGGGALPGETFDTHVVHVTPQHMSVNALEAHLRGLERPIIATIRKNELILDVRTIDPSDFAYIGQVFQEL